MGCCTPQGSYAVVRDRTRVLRQLYRYGHAPSPRFFAAFPSSPVPVHTHHLSGKMTIGRQASHSPSPRGLGTPCGWTAPSKASASGSDLGTRTRSQPCHAPAVEEANSNWGTLLPRSGISGAGNHRREKMREAGTQREWGQGEAATVCLCRLHVLSPRSSFGCVMPTGIPPGQTLHTC